MPFRRERNLPAARRFYRLAKVAIAGRDVARLQPAFEPLCALCGRTVGEAFRADPPLRHALQPVIADGSRGIEALRGVSLIDNVPLFGRVSPIHRRSNRLCSSTRTES